MDLLYHIMNFKNTVGVQKMSYLFYLQNIAQQQLTKVIAVKIQNIL